MPTNYHLTATTIDVDTAGSTALSDWNRVRNEGGLLINGRPIAELQTEAFKDENELKAFFITHLLTEVPEEKQEESANYLLKGLHQGGLLYPLATCLNESLEKAGFIVGEIQGKVVNIVPCETGINIHETGSIMQLGEFAAPKPIKSQKGGALFDASAIVGVDFSASTDTPGITITNSELTFFDGKAAQARMQQSGIIDLIPPSPTSEHYHTANREHATFTFYPPSTAPIPSWQNEQFLANCYIGDRPLSSYRDEYNNFTKMADVQAFCRAVLAKDIPAVKRDSAATLLANTFHDMADMFAVSRQPFDSSLTKLTAHGIQRASMVSQEIIDISTTPTGISIKHRAALNHASTAGGKLEAEAGKDYLLKMATSVDVDCTSPSDKVLVTRKKTLSDYGNHVIKASLDDRNPAERLKDKLLRRVGKTNTAITPHAESPHTESAHAEPPPSRDLRQHFKGPEVQKHDPVANEESSEDLTAGNSSKYTF